MIESNNIFLKIRSSKSAIVLLIVAGVLLPLLVVELALRWLAPVSLNAVSTTVKQDLPGLRSEIVYERDDLGLRRLGTETSRNAMADVRVLCIGASTTDQPTQETRDTWCAQLQVLLQEKFSPQRVRIETATFAHGGWRMADLVARVPSVLDEFHPDVVTVLMGVNDLTFNGGGGYTYEGIAERVASIQSREASLGRGLWHQCEVVSQLCRRLIVLKQRVYSWLHIDLSRSLEWHSRNLQNLRREYQQYEYVEVLQRKLDPLREFEDGVDAVLTLLDQRGIAAVVLGQPILWKQTMTEAERLALWFFVETPAGRVRPSGAWLQQEMGRFNDAQMRVASKHRASYLNLDEVIPKDLDHYFDDCHFTDLGSRRVAREVFPLLAAAVEERLRGRRVLLE